MERLARAFLVYVRELEPWVLRTAPGVNPDIQKCAASILANFGEGWDEPSRGDKRKFFRYAHRSAGEAERLLIGLQDLHGIPSPMLDRGLRLLLDIKMDLARLVRHFTP